MTMQTSKRMATLYTSNGFCSCAKLRDCLQEKEDDCGFRDTAGALYDGVERPARTFSGASRCLDQLDWPYQAGNMRDGSTMDSRNPDDTPGNSSSPCDVSERLPRFWYRFVPSGNISAPASTSLDKGGACHMGTAPTLPPSYEYETGTCNKLSETTDNVTVQCFFTNGEDTIMVITNPELNRLHQPLLNRKRYPLLGYEQDRG
jgi:hypothetical protein